MNFRQYDFSNNAERLYLESLFSEWYIHEYQNGQYEELEEWFRDFFADKIDYDAHGSKIPKLFRAFAAGMIYGQELADGLMRLQDLDMKKWKDQEESETE